MKLEDTIGLMCSEDYKDRMKAEYIQLCIRHNKLQRMIARYSKHELDFEPTCPSALLIAQELAMSQYREIMRQRLSLEDVPIGEILETLMEEE